jgi:hypothetical protein
LTAAIAVAGPSPVPSIAPDDPVSLNSTGADVPMAFATLRIYTSLTDTTNDTHGEVAMKYLRKGSQAYVEGQIETRSWENDWQKHYATEVVLRPFNSELLLLNKAERPAAQPAQRRERGAEPS